jgi:thiamine kinase-like enzyme
MWLVEQYGGIDKINERLVFSHNDVSSQSKHHVEIKADHITLQTQYGNILRMVPEGESPLLLPANKHKQLVVIDFEYANANLPGLEFANHFVGSISSYLSLTLFTPSSQNYITDTDRCTRQSGHTTTMTQSTRGAATRSTIQHWKSSIASSGLICCTHLHTEHRVVLLQTHRPRI